MKKIPMWQFVVLAFVFAGYVRAEAILSLTFDDPNGLIKTKPEGITAIGSEFAAKGATIASGFGGRALPQINLGPGSVAKGKNEGRVQILNEPPFGPAPFVHLSLSADSTVRSVGVSIIPDSLERSLGSFVTYDKGHECINGAFDLFFRFTTEGNAQPKFGIWTKVGILGFSLSLDPDDHTLYLKVFSSKNSLSMEGGKEGKATLNSQSRRVARIDPGEIYHLGILFNSSAEGAVTIDICLQPGLEPMNPGESIVASLSGILIAEEDRRLSPDKIGINLGQNNVSQSLDIAAFRIFKAVPETFPGLDGKL